MKKILASIIIAMMLISVGVNVFADETKSTEQTTQTTSESTSKDSSITLKITEKVEVEDVTKEVKVVIGYDKLESIDTSGICMFKGIFKYSDVYFNQLTQNDIKALNGYTVQFSEESGRLLVEANRTPKDVAEITLTFKEGLENVTTTGVFFEVEELTDGKNEYDTPKLVTQVAVVQKADKTEETKDEQKNTETTKDEQKNTETTKDDNKKDELEIITNTTKTDNTTEKTTQDTTVSQEKELPKTGATTVALIVLAVVAIGTISLIRYKNIEIK